jgi:hypothetical protein
LPIAADRKLAFFIDRKTAKPPADFFIARLRCDTYSTNASSKQPVSLDVPLNAPVCFVDRSATDQRNRLVLVSKGIYRGDVVRIDVKLR